MVRRSTITTIASNRSLVGKLVTKSMKSSSQGHSGTVRGWWLLKGEWGTWFGLTAGVAVAEVLLDVLPHLWPVKPSGDEVEGLC